MTVSQKKLLLEIAEELPCNIDLDASSYIEGSKNHHQIKLDGWKAECEIGEFLFGLKSSGEVELVSLLLYHKN